VRCAIVDPKETRARRIAAELRAQPAIEVTSRRSIDAVNQFEAAHVDLVLLVDPGSIQAAAEAVVALRSRRPHVVVLVALPAAATADSGGYLAAGADDLVWLPVRPEDVYLRYQAQSARRAATQEARRVRAAVAARAFPDIVGEADAMRRVLQQVHQVATSDASVLLVGETGTGKAIIARGLHALSQRRNAPFLAVNLSALPESLAESELFGHEKGAFTGARTSRQGRLDAVEGGILFLDEVGDLSLSVQVKLLCVLEEPTFERLGSTSARRADFQLICATHRDLDAMVAAGSFREDLYYRINVVRIALPPLRERREDVPRLAEHFLTRFCDKHGGKKVAITDAAMQALQRHEWPGNVRELQHIIEHAIAMSLAEGVIDENVLWLRKPRVAFRKEVQRYVEDGRGLREILADIERTMIVETLERVGGNQVAAAKKLAIPRQTLQNRLKKYGR
jgi:DNA-binding NtrC family response regulator